MTPLVKKSLNTVKSALDQGYHEHVSIKNDAYNLLRDISAGKVDHDAIFAILQRIMKTSESGAAHIHEAQGWIEALIQSED